MRTLTFLTTICLLMSLSSGMAQSSSIVFSYDDAGNRIKREFLEVTFMGMGMASDSTALETDQKKEQMNEQKAIAQTGIKVYPNPTQDIILVELSGTEESRYILYDISGKTIIEGRSTSSIASLDLSGFSPGTYFLTVKAAKKETKWQVIKQ